MKSFASAVATVPGACSWLHGSGLVLLCRYAVIAAFVCVFQIRGEEADATELKEVVAALEHGYQSLNDVQGSFAQRSVIAGINREQKGAGEFALRKVPNGPAMFRFSYTKPQRQEIIYNGKTVWLYTPDSRQVMQTDTETLFAGGNGIALSYLTGLGQVSRDFTIVFARERQDRKGNYVLELTPRQVSPVLAKLVLIVSRGVVDQYLETGTVSDQFPVVASTVTDSGGNRTSMEFTGIRTNRGIGPSRFSFKVPTGVEVLKQ